MRLGGEHLAAVDRAGEDRLERAVAVLGGDDVPRDQRGDQRQHEHGQEQQHQHGRRQARLGDVRGEDVALVVAVVVVQSSTSTKISGRMPASAEAEVGALLGDELAHLPRHTVSVEGRLRRAPAAARRPRTGVLRRRCSSDLDRPGGGPVGQCRPRRGARSSAGPPEARPAAAPPSVSRKNRSSSVASSGVSARIPMPARPSASDSAPTSCSSAWKPMPCSPAAACSIPGCARASASARASSVVRSR